MSWRQEKKQGGGLGGDCSSLARETVAWTRVGRGDGKGSALGCILQAGLVNGSEVECEGERELTGFPAEQPGDW